MTEKLVKQRKLKKLTKAEKNLAYWLTKTPEERVAEIERLRKQRYGDSVKLERVVRIRKLR